MVLFAATIFVIIYLGLVLFGRLRLVPSFDFILNQPKRVELKLEGPYTNGAIADFQNGQYIALRKIEDHNSSIWLAKKQGDDVKEITKLSLRSTFAEDPRLIVYNNQLVVVYNDLVDRSRRMHLAFLTLDNETFEVQKIQALKKEGAEKNTEKNWVPFVFEDQLYFVYETQPWTILKYEQDGTCSVFKSTDILIPGETPYLSGGTPAVQIGDEFVSFYHIRSGVTRSYISWNRYIYLVGAYTFEAKPPFDLKKLTVRPLSYRGAYNLNDNPKKILYPVGLIEQKDHFELSLGVNDDRTEIVHVDKEKLFSLMSPV